MKNYSEELNQEQLDAVLHGDGPCLVLAGAGSGKTRTVTYRVAYLLEQGVDPNSILLLTFTNKAAREMLDRIGSLVGPQAKGVWGGTFHAVANRILRSFAPAVGYSNQFSILDEEDAQSMVKAVIKDAKIDPKARRFPSAAVIRNVYSFSRNTDIPINEVLEMKYPNFLDCANDLEFLVKQYQQRKQQANSMDFDDLLWNWLRLMETQPQIADQISRRFAHILVDEYQDTNTLQARLIGKLGQVHKNIFVVGDDAQSIYAFRGADVKNILAFPGQWPEAKIFKLVSNYRSTPQILDCANASLKNNVNQYKKDLVSLKAAGVKPVVLSCPSARIEAEYIADQILTLRNQGVALANIAILFRASSHSQALEFELMKRDVPFEYRGGIKFFERAHIKDVLAYIRLLVNPKDESAWLRVLNMQAGVGAASISLILQEVRAAESTDLGTMSQSLQIPERAVAGWHKAHSVLSLLRDQTTPGAMIRAVAGADNYKLYLEAEYPDWRDRQEDLQQLAVFADTYTDVKSFLADAVLDDASFKRVQGDDAGRSGRATSDDDHLILSTVHQAKGLEWDTVFVIHLTSIGFPSPRALEEEDSIEEERRLFYVAITRARNRLFLTYPQVAGFDAMTFCRPSMFLEELPPHLVQNQQVGGSVSARRTVDWLDSTDDWFGDADEPTIELDRYGHKKHSAEVTPPKTSIWKSAKKSKNAPLLSFLRDVEDL